LARLGVTLERHDRVFITEAASGRQFAVGVALNGLSGALLATALAGYWEFLSDPEVAAMVGVRRTWTTALIAAGSLVFYLSFGLAVTGLMLFSDSASLSARWSFIAERAANGHSLAEPR